MQRAEASLIDRMDLNTFLQWAESSSQLQECVHQMSFVACVVFNLKPDSGVLERRIVEWLWTQATKSIKVGQVHDDTDSDADSYLASFL